MSNADVTEIITRSLGAVGIGTGSISVSIASARRILKELRRGEQVVLTSGKGKISRSVVSLFCLLFLIIGAAVSVGTYFLLVFIYADTQPTNTSLIL